MKRSLPVPRPFKFPPSFFGQFPVAVDRQIVPGLRLARGPANGEPANRCAIAKSENDALVAGRQIAAPAFDDTEQLLPADLQFQFRPYRIAVPFANQLDAEPVI